MEDVEIAEADDLNVLESLLNNGYDGSADELALALGLNPEELESRLNGEVEIDGDLAMKMRGLAQERGIEID